MRHAAAALKWATACGSSTCNYENIHYYATSSSTIVTTWSDSDGIVASDRAIETSWSLLLCHLGTWE
jgi:hypothetical protein